MSFEPLIPVGLSLFSRERGNKRLRKNRGERPFLRMKTPTSARVLGLYSFRWMCEPVRGCSCMCRPAGATLCNNAARGGGEENGLFNLYGKLRRTLRGWRCFRPSTSRRGSNAGLMASAGEGGNWRHNWKDINASGKRTLKERRGDVDCLAHFPQHRSILQCPRPFPTRDA